MPSLGEPLLESTRFFVESTDLRDPAAAETESGGLMLEVCCQSGDLT